MHSWDKMTIKAHIFVNQIQVGTPRVRSHGCCPASPCVSLKTMGRARLDTTAAIFSIYVIMISDRCSEGKHFICFSGDEGTIKQRRLLFKLVIVSVCKRHDGIC